MWKKNEESSVRAVKEPRKINKRRRKYICLAVSCFIIAIVLVILILAFTVFKAKNPIITVQSVALQDFKTVYSLLPPMVSMNASIDLQISIKNPNKVEIKYENSSAILQHKYKEIGNVPIPAGEIGSGETKPLDLMLTVFADRVLMSSELYFDIANGNLPLSAYTEISGEVNVLNLFYIHVGSTLTCDLNIDISSKTIVNQKCHIKYKK